MSSPPTKDGARADDVGGGVCTRRPRSSSTAKWMRDARSAHRKRRRELRRATSLTSLYCCRSGWRGRARLALALAASRAARQRMRATSFERREEGEGPRCGCVYVCINSRGRGGGRWLADGGRNGRSRSVSSRRRCSRLSFAPIGPLQDRRAADPSPPAIDGPPQRVLRKDSRLL